MTASARRAAAALAVGTSLLSTGCAALSVDKDVDPQPAAEQAKVGGVVRVATTQPATLDPAAASDPGALLVTSLLCEPLLQRDPKTGEPRPGLVTRWLVTDGGKRLTLTLRRGVKFPDGSDLTSEDVAATLSRVAQVDTASPYAEELAHVRGYDTVHGEKETTSSVLKRELTGVSPTDKYNVEIALDRPDAGFLMLLTEQFTAPVSSEFADARGARKAADERLESNPMCIGPYELTDPLTAGREGLSLVRRADYYGGGTAWTNGGRGYVDRFEFSFVESAKQGRDAFAKGQVDVVGVPAREVAAARQAGDGRLVTIPTEEIEYLGAPMQLEPFGKPAARRALSLALDRTALAKAAYAGTKTPALSLVSPAVGEAYADTRCPDARPTADPAAAKAALAEVGEELPALTLTVNDEHGHGPYADLVAKQLRANLGVEVTVEKLPWADFLAKGTQSPGFSTLFRVSWTPARPDGDAVIAPLFTGVNAGTTNLASYDNGDVQDFLDERARETEDLLDAEAEYRTLLEDLCEEMPLVPVLQGSRSWLIRNTVASAVDAWGTSDGLPALRELYMASASADG